MVNFIDVDPANLPTSREGRRGRVSYPICKTFLETGKLCVQLDRKGMQQSFQALYSMLNAYVKSHTLPIKIFSSQGELFLMRIDMNAHGNKIENWQKENKTDGVSLDESHMEALPIDADEVSRRAEIEKPQVTK